MKNLIKMSLIFSSLIFAFGLLTLAFMLVSQAFAYLLVTTPDEYFPAIVLGSGAIAVMTFATYRRKIWWSIQEFWTQLLRNL